MVIMFERCFVVRTQHLFILVVFATLIFYYAFFAQWFIISKRKMTLKTTENKGNIQRIIQIEEKRQKRLNKVEKRIGHMSHIYYICPYFRGRSGNLLFQFASAFGIANTKNMTILLNKNDKLNTLFKFKNSSHLRILQDTSICNKTVVKREKRACAYDKSVLNFKPNSHYKIKQYLQSWKYFKNSSKQLKLQMVFRNHIRKSVKKIIRVMLKRHGYKSRENVTLIAIHVRRGDMVNHSYGYNVATKEYFTKAIEMFKNYKYTIFIICSDDLTWAKGNIKSDHTLEFISGNKPEIDMALMASCDHMIMSVGSFGWWSGWLQKGDGKITYFKWPAKDGSALRKDFSKDYMDFFYPHWIGI